MNDHASLDKLLLVHADDAFELLLELDGERCVILRRVVRFPHNQNVEGVETAFFDLDPDAKRAVVRQINRRYVGKTVKI